MFTKPHYIEQKINQTIITHFSTFSCEAIIPNDDYFQMALEYQGDK